MVGGKREKDEFTLFKEQARSIKGRHEAVKDKGLNIKDVSFEKVKIRNPKHEIRNKHEIQMTKILN